jgi:hypothetical protein
LINAGQMTRASALEEIEAEPYAAELADRDRLYVIKKLAISEAEFERLMALPRRTFRDYPNNFARIERLKRFANALRARGWYAR